MNTLENVLFGMEACEKNGFYPKNLILAAIPPLLRRARATFAKQFPAIATWGSAFTISSAEYASWLKRLLAEFDRFDEYAQKGDIERIEIPPDVFGAIIFLKRLPVAGTTDFHFYSNS